MTPYNFDALVTNDLTLTAFYKINEGVETVLVVLDYQNEGQINNVTIAKGTSMSEPPKPEKTGYVFEGWFCQDKIFDFTTKIESNIVLVAKWKLDEKATSTTNNKKPSTDTNTKKPTDTSKPTDNSNDNSAVCLLKATS